MADKDVSMTKHASLLRSNDKKFLSKDPKQFKESFLPKNCTLFILKFSSAFNFLHIFFLKTEVAM
jgi:hypothetical protein